MSALLLVSDLTYPARGRRYGDEDAYLASRLRAHFDVALCHPADAVALMDRFDVVLVRNSGPVLHYPAEYAAFRAHALANGTAVFNPLHGRGDMAGKQYLVDLSAAGYPVIPTVDRVEDVDRLPDVAGYVVKPKAGADSVGLLRTDRAGIPAGGDILIQPEVDFEYEVSFYFVDHQFHYALHAPDPGKRWELRPYEPNGDDLAFAERFVRWNTLDHGIQRVDACRTAAGLLLVELEDLNPYLSLDLVDESTRDTFVEAVAASLRDLSGH
ncbi:hypothetical protein [Actinokineospora terrae]|uniref:Glutathione synthase/RimK-type ligase, ATP-grasp superfamily n=1 Tax=Actinokineospora terrae TaxID=155974 RepID=A0A1H9MZN9_9PSEU|nr:hypothetical protein [Actinokineospora terrae]SER29164.1 hypothetical protein SAMN04487818_102428 [Actinokineospora terrae]